MSLREVKRQRRLLKAPPHKASSRSMITLSGGGREDARREDMQRGHLRDKSRFFPPPSTLEQSGRAIISRFIFFLVVTVIYNGGRYTSRVMFIHYHGCEGRRRMDGVTITTALEALKTLFTERFHSKTHSNISLVHTVG